MTPPLLRQVIDPSGDLLNRMSFTPFRRRLTFDLSPKHSGKTWPLKGVEIDFRIPFQLSSIQGGMSMIGDSHDNFKFLSLDFSGEKSLALFPVLLLLLTVLL